ncbi:MAG: T9SS type A sorting domain-containing protein, partial [Cryomorphaceae bacterium]
QITYLGGGSCPDPVTACEAGTFDAASIPAEVCPLIAFDYAATGVSIPNSPLAGEYAITFDAVPGSGAGGPFETEPDPSFILTLGTPGAGSENEDVLVSIDNVLTTAGGAPALTGEWVLTGGVVAGGVFCDSLTAVTVDFLTAADAGCEPVTACEAGVVDQAGIDNDLCQDETTDYNLTGFTIPNTPVLGEYIIEFTPVPGSGSGGPFGAEPDPAFFLTLNAPAGSENADATVTIGATLLDAVGEELPPMLGEWSIRGAIATGTALCDSVPAVVIDFLDENDPACGGVVPCANPYPAVDNASLSAVQNGNGSITFSWTPINGQIGCQVNARIGDPGNPTAQTSIILGGPTRDSFTAGVSALAPYPFQTINFRVRCGCQQNPSTIAGPYTDFISILNIPPSSSAISVVSDQNVKHLYAEVEGNRLTPAVTQTMDTWAPVQNPNSMTGTVSKSVSASAKKSFDVFPNPTTGSVNLNYAAAAEGMVNLRVFDIVGKAVADYSFAVNEGENFINLDLSSFEKGIYVVQVLDGGTSSTAKVVLK